MAVPERRQLLLPVQDPAPNEEPRDPIPWDLARAYAGKVALALCKGRFAHLEDDVVQDAMLRLYKYKGPIRTSWKALLRKIVLHAARELIGGEIKSRRSFCHDREALDGVRCPEAGIPEVVAAAELESRLPATLAALEAKLGPDTRAVVELRALGRPWEEISKVLDIPLRSCSFRFCKAEDWVRKELSLPPRKGDDHE